MLSIKLQKRLDNDHLIITYTGPGSEKYLHGTVSHSVILSNVSDAFSLFIKKDSKTLKRDVIFNNFYTYH